MEYSYEPIDVNKYGCHTYNYLLQQAKKNKVNLDFLKKDPYNRKSKKNRQEEEKNENFNYFHDNMSSNKLNSSSRSHNKYVSNSVSQKNSSSNNIQGDDHEYDQNDSQNQRGFPGGQNDVSLDNRLVYTMNALGLESLTHIFVNNKITFNDLLFMTKEDLTELNFRMFQKNRILNFINEYTQTAKNYTMGEIECFFKANPKYNSLQNINVNNSSNIYEFS